MFDTFEQQGLMTTHDESYIEGYGGDELDMASNYYNKSKYEQTIFWSKDDIFDHNYQILFVTKEIHMHSNYSDIR